MRGQRDTSGEGQRHLSSAVTYAVLGKLVHALLSAGTTGL